MTLKHVGGTMPTQVDAIQVVQTLHRFHIGPLIPRIVPFINVLTEMEKAAMKKEVVVWSL